MGVGWKENFELFANVASKKYVYIITEKKDGFLGDFAPRREEEGWVKIITWEGI